MSQLTVSFVSNYLNHLQIPFSLEMASALGDGYKFIAYAPMETERVAMGWEVRQRYPFELKAYENERTLEEAEQLIYDSDVVIAAAPAAFTTRRIRDGKLTFFCGERLFKKGAIRLLDPRVFYSVTREHTAYRHQRNLHMLCISAYAAQDLRLLGAYPDRMWKWGYFTSVPEVDITALLQKKTKAVPSILWAGRSISWKRPEYAIYAAKAVTEMGIPFTMEVIGSGECEARLRKLVDIYHLAPQVTLTPFLTPAEVRERMEQADIFLPTSNYQEGWGAVINEGMSSGCALVVSAAMGAATFLIDDRKNGYLFHHQQQMIRALRDLLNDRAALAQTGANAYQTMRTLWNPQVAAERFIMLSRSLLSGQPVLFDEGPCCKI